MTNWHLSINVINFMTCRNMAVCWMVCGGIVAVFLYVVIVCNMRKICLQTSMACIQVNNQKRFAIGLVLFFISTYSILVGTYTRKRFCEFLYIIQPIDFMSCILKCCFLSQRSWKHLSRQMWKFHCGYVWIVLNVISEKSWFKHSQLKEYAITKCTSLGIVNVIYSSL